MIRRAVAWYNRPNKSWLAENVEGIIVVLMAAFLIRTFFFGLYQVPTGSMETTMLVGERFFADKFTVLFWSPQRGDIISFNDPTYGYSDNSLIYFYQQYVWGPENWTKRVIGVPGDHVVGKIEDGKPVIYLNGEKLDEPYLNKYPLVPVRRGNDMGWYSYDPSVPYDQQPFYRMDGNEVKRIQRCLARAGVQYVREPGTPIDNEHQRDLFDVKLGPGQYWAMGDNRLGSSDSRAFGPLNGKFIHGKIVLRIFSIDSEYSWWIFDLLFHPISFWGKIRWHRLFQVLH